MSRDLLLELGTEDLPARYVVPLSNALKQGLTDGLARLGLSCEQSHSFATPRRIAVILTGLAVEQPEQKVERLGPALKAALKDGQPTQAALGFARSCGVSFEELGEKNGKLFFARTEAGRPTAELIPEVFAETLKKMDQLVPKRMRWGSGEETFVRPVEWICCVFGDAVVPLQAFGLSAGARSYGHRFHAPDAIEPVVPARYLEALRKAHVLADVAERRTRVRAQIEEEASRIGGHVRIPEELLDEVTSLVEWPVAISGSFEEKYLALPPEVIVSTVETNQRYFTVFRDAGQTKLTHHFITVSNIESRDVAQVIGGNERVVRPRLSDALFFWQQDLKQPLAAYADKLGSVTFQKDLGSTADKVARMVEIASWLAGELGEDAAAAARATALCKADLLTQAVFEMPELQGIMGGYYARESGESEAVSRAISQHYLPAQQGTAIPDSRLGQIVSLADKLDSLAGIFAIGQKPTASKDPYALRRAALGVLRICLEAELPLNAVQLVGRALEAQRAGDRDEKTNQSLRAFMLDRLQNLLVGSPRTQGRVTPEVYEAAITAMPDAVPTYDVLRRIDAVLQFLSLPEAADLAAASKRVRNILKQSEEAPGEVAADRFEAAAERDLLSSIIELEQKNAALDNYTDKLIQLAALRSPVDAFFEAVMVNADDADVRRNRLALLARLDRMCRDVADLSCLPG
tara:strand:- start:893 stop:2965 length:2073 start_codon:yes stop_codon:yes gene_type:complete